MIRFVLVILIWVFFVGGVLMYLHRKPPVVAGVAPTVDTPAETPDDADTSDPMENLFDGHRVIKDRIVGWLRLEATSAMGTDPYVLKLGDEEKRPIINALLNGVDVASSSTFSSEHYQFPLPKSLCRAGTNEIVLSGTPVPRVNENGQQLAVAVRVWIFPPDGDLLIMSPQVIWIQPGMRLSERLLFEWNGQKQPAVQENGGREHE